MPSTETTYFAEEPRGYGWTLVGVGEEDGHDVWYWEREDD